jgi:hypothetical protein
VNFIDFSDFFKNHPDRPCPIFFIRMNFQTVGKTCREVDSWEKAKNEKTRRVLPLRMGPWKPWPVAQGDETAPEDDRLVPVVALDEMTIADESGLHRDVEEGYVINRADYEQDSRDADGGGGCSSTIYMEALEQSPFKYDLQFVGKQTRPRQRNTGHAISAGQNKSAGANSSFYNPLLRGK